MVDSNKSAMDLLAELRQERDDLTRLVQALEKRLGIGDGFILSDSDVHPTSKSTPSFEGIPVGFFHNLSQAAAAEKLLRLHPQSALTTGQILDAFRRGGMAVGTNASTILYTALKRSTRFERVAGKAWGLAEWYPSRGRKKDPEESESDEEESSED